MPVEVCFASVGTGTCLRGSQRPSARGGSLRARQRRPFPPEPKVARLRLHLLEHKPVSDRCQEHHLSVNLFSLGQEQFFENGTAAFANTGKRCPAEADAQGRTIAAPEGKLRVKNDALAERREEHVRLKKEPGEPGPALGFPTTPAMPSSSSSTAGPARPASPCPRSGGGSASPPARGLPGSTATARPTSPALGSRAPLGWRLRRNKRSSIPTPPTRGRASAA